MSKISCIVSCPCDTYSGYGRRALDFVKELIYKKPDWDVRILSQRWGDTRQGYLQDHGEWEILSRIVPAITQKPDVWIQITVPNEFQPVGTYNIGVTAAIETNLCDASWIEGCNRMNLVLVSSVHGKKSLTESRYRNNQTGYELKVTVPVEVLFEGIDSSIYFKKDQPEETSILDGVETSWNYLCIGHWMQGDFGEDRKNIGYTIKAFLEAFKDKENAPGLILKTSQAVASYVDQEIILNKIYEVQSTVQYTKSLPKIYLLHGDLTDKEVNDLYNDPRVKAMVSFTKGEGYGRPLAEFASIGKPILASGWSGYLDFLDTKYTALVGGSLEKVHPSAVLPHMILQEAAWFKPNDEQALAGLLEVYKNYDFWLRKANKQAKMLQFTRNLGAMGEELETILDNNLPEFPEEVAIRAFPELENLMKNGEESRN